MLVDLLKSPLAQKAITGVVGLAVGWANKKFGWGLDPISIGGTAMAIILGIAIHANGKAQAPVADSK